MAYVDPADETEVRMVQIPGQELKRLKKESKAAREAEARIAAAERELAFYKAGVDLEHPAATYFVKGYEGEATPEAVKAEWVKLTGSTGEAKPDPAAEELAQMQDAADLVNGRGQIPTDKLAERNQKLAALSDGDRHYDEKFRAIMDEYGGIIGTLHS